MQSRFNLTGHSAAGRRLLAVTPVLLVLCWSASAQTTNSVTGGNNVNYTINGQADPPFTLQRGVLYVFQLSNVAFHPFWIKSSLGFGSAGRFDDGVSNNGATSGSVIFAVPASAPDTLYYQCGNHSSMNGTLTIVTPSVPPLVRIVFINVADFVTLKSTGTNGWSAVPEYLCGLPGTNWTAVSAFTNALADGTNTTTFQRLDALCGSSNIFLRIRNTQIP